jgi:hypothetical protein
VIPIPDGLTAKRPPAWASWNDLGPRPLPGDPFVHVWTRGRLTVFSTLAWTLFQGVEMWHFMISVSARGKYATDDEVARALRDFDMQPADEDNHESGAGIRKWFLPCSWEPGDPSVCECKATEQTVVEPSGYKWQAPVDADLDAKRVEQAAINRAAACVKYVLP